MSLGKLDSRLITFFGKVCTPFSRLALFIIFFWFGLLKVLELSPASGLVIDLLERTIPFVGPGTFLIMFGLFECLIGILFLIKGAERWALFLLLIHMITTFGPLFFLPLETWQSFMVPTLEGQYIIKNLAIIATAIGLVSRLKPAHGK